MPQEHSLEKLASVVVLIPVYKETLDTHEEFSVDYSLAIIMQRDIRFIAPENLGTTYYEQRYPGVPIDRFPPPCFESIQEYNRLLLNPDFYKRYSRFQFMLILQTDAIVLKDELDFWCTRPFDYVGAPWPRAYELNLETGRFEGGFSKHVHVNVGNGGLSLRRIFKCIQLLAEFKVEADVFRRTGSSEDLFFSVMGSLSTDFILPNEVTASMFSMEGSPSYYFKINGGHSPMGAHAWRINEPDFLMNFMERSGHLPMPPDDK